MRRRLNVRFLAILVAASILLGGGVALAHYLQVRRTAPRLLARAEKAEALGRPDRAIGFLGRYLAIRRDDPEALDRLGTLTEKHAGGNPDLQAQALLRYEQALRADPKRAETRRRLVRLALELRPPRTTLAMDGLRALGAEASGDGELELLLGRCHEADGRPDAAVDAYRKARAHRPDLVMASTRLAALLRAGHLGAAAKAAGKRDAAAELAAGRVEADRVMDELVAANPRSAEAVLARGLYRRRLGRPEGEADVARALELAPDSAAALAANVDRALSRKDWDAARGLLERLIKAVPRSRTAYRRLAAVEVETGHLDRAAERLVAGLQALPDDDELRRDLAEVHIRRGQYDEAGGVIDALRKTGRRPEQGEYLAARLLAVRGRWPEAARALEAVRPKLAAAPELSRGADALLALCYQRLGDVDGEVEAGRRLAAAAPTAAQPHRTLAAAYEAMGRHAEALAEYRQLPPDEPGVKVAIARATLLQTLTLPPDRRRWDEAERALAAAVAAEPKSPLVAVLRADMLAARGDLGKAVDELTKARDAAPDEPATWLALAAALERQGKADAVAKLLDEAAAKLGDRVELRLLRARRLAVAGGKDAPAQIAALGRDLDTFPADDRRRLALGLANARALAGDPAGALATWRAWARGQGDDHRQLLVTFDMAIRARDAAVMAETIAALRRVEGPDGVGWRYAEARRLVLDATLGRNRKGLAEARVLLGEVAKRRPNWSNVPLVLAEIDELEGDVDRALRDYDAAIALGESDPDVLGRVVRLMTDRGRYADAERVLARLQDQSVSTNVLRRMAAVVSLRSGDTARALELARRAVAADSKDYRDHLFLAQALAAGRRGPEAEAALRRAVELAGDRPDAHVELVRYLAAAGLRDKAAAAAAAAAGALGEAKQPLALAECYRLAGRGDDADRLYRQALAANPDDPTTLREAGTRFIQAGRLRDAQPLLEHLVALGPEAGDDARWARNSLALVLTAAGDPAQAGKVLALLGLDGPRPATTAGDPAARDERRTQVRILALQRDDRRRREAAAMLEDLTSGADATPADLVLLGQLYEGLGEWKKARAKLVAAAEADRTARTIVPLAQALLRNKEFADVDRWLDRLDPTPGTVRLKAQALRDRGQAKEAVAYVEAFGGEKRQPEAAAAILESLGQLGPAERAYRDLARAAPRGGLALARFLGRHDRLDEALDLCDAAWASCPPPEVATATVEVVNGPGVGEGPRARAAQRIEAATGRDPDRRELVVSLAILRGLQGRYDDAEALYRKALAAEPRDVVALNNLAWLLALRGTKRPEALALVERAIAVAGAQPALLDTRAVVLLGMDRVDPAIRDLEQAVAAEPEAAKYFHLARAHWLAKSPAAAAAALKNGKELGLKDAALDPLERPEYRRLEVAIGGGK